MSGRGKVNPSLKPVANTASVFAVTAPFRKLSQSWETYKKSPWQHCVILGHGWKWTSSAVRVEVRQRIHTLLVPFIISAPAYSRSATENMFDNPRVVRPSLMTANLKQWKPIWRAEPGPTKARCEYLTSKSRVPPLCHAVSQHHSRGATVGVKVFPQIKPSSLIDTPGLAQTSPCLNCWVGWDQFKVGLAREHVSHLDSVTLLGLQL